MFSSPASSSFILKNDSMERKKTLINLNVKTYTFYPVQQIFPSQISCKLELEVLLESAVVSYSANDGYKESLFELLGPQKIKKQTSMLVMYKHNLEPQLILTAWVSQTLLHWSFFPC